MQSAEMARENDVMLHVFQTRNYNMFSLVEGNRNINRLHVERLKKSMKEEYLISPIIVNEHYEIIDGQHRFTAIKELGKKLYYIICEKYRLPQVQRLNKINVTWRKSDFLDGYVSLGKKEYIRTKQFMDTNNITSVNLALELLDKEASQSKKEIDFKNGVWKIKSIEWAREFMKKLIDFRPYFDAYNTVLFAKAFKKIYEYNKYDHDNMKKKLEYMGPHIESRSSIEQYIEMLLEIYNYRTMKEKKIIFADGELMSH